MLPMRSIVISFLLYVVFLNQVISLDVVANKTGEEQVKEALDKAEKESAQAAKIKTDKNDTNTTKKNEKVDSKESASLDNPATPTSADAQATGVESAQHSKLTKEDLDKVIAGKIAELEKLRAKSKHFHAGESNSDVEDDNSVTKEKHSSKIVNDHDRQSNSNLESNTISTLLKSAEAKEKENTELEEESDKRMINMAKKLNKLVLKFQKKMGHLNRRPKTVDDALNEDNDESTVKDVRGKTATRHPSRASIDLGALRNAMGLLHMRHGAMKYADDSNAKTSYKEDVKLEDRLALEAEEEKKVTDGDNYDGDSATEAEAGVDKSTTASSPSLSPKEQASQEMQSYNALISTESNRELSQIQDEISKATQSSMGKVSVVGQKEYVHTESPIPGLGDDPGLAAALSAGGGLEGLGGSSDSILQKLQGGGGDANLLAAEASNSEQTSAALQGGLPQELLGEAGQGGNPASVSASLTDSGGQKPIEFGSSAPVDMGMFNGAASIQKGLQGPETGEQPMDTQSNFINQSPSMMNLQGLGQQQPGMFKKSKISKGRKKGKKAKTYKRNIRKSTRKQK